MTGLRKGAFGPATRVLTIRVEVQGIAHRISGGVGLDAPRRFRHDADQRGVLLITRGSLNRVEGGNPADEHPPATPTQSPNSMKLAIPISCPCS